MLTQREPGPVRTWASESRDAESLDAERQGGLAQSSVRARSMARSRARRAMSDDKQR